MAGLSNWVCLVVVSCWIVWGCQPAKKNDTGSDGAGLASLATTTYHLGDTITIGVDQSLTQVSVTFDNKEERLVNQNTQAVRVSTSGQTIGPHQLIVRGIAADQKPLADTLNIELWPTTPPLTLQYSVVKSYPHQTSSFTQGLEFHGKTLYESTGLHKESNVMQVDLETGSIRKSVPLAEQYFGEGITIINDKIYQLTWLSGVCFRYSMDFKLEKMFPYHTQGWGLTHRDTTLIMSDGTNKLYFYTPGFKLKSEVAVYDNNGPVNRLNELEYANGYVFANVWQTNRIVQIDPASGIVVGVMHMDPILPPGTSKEDDVLNGIAYQPQEKAFYITGKRWPTLYKLNVSQIAL